MEPGSRKKRRKKKSLPMNLTLKTRGIPNKMMNSIKNKKPSKRRLKSLILPRILPFRIGSLTQ